MTCACIVVGKAESACLIKGREHLQLYVLGVIAYTDIFEIDTKSIPLSLNDITIFPSSSSSPLHFRATLLNAISSCPIDTIKKVIKTFGISISIMEELEDEVEQRSPSREMEMEEDFPSPVYSPVRVQRSKRKLTNGSM
jgi:hypothetical protein